MEPFYRIFSLIVHPGYRSIEAQPVFEKAAQIVYSMDNSLQKLSGIDNSILDRFHAQLFSIRQDIQRLGSLAFHHQENERIKHYASTTRQYRFILGLFATIVLFGGILIGTLMHQQRQSQRAAKELDNANEDLRQRGDELQLLVEELEAKNIELDRFVYTVSHEIKSPLVTISGYSGMLKKNLAKGNSGKLEEDIQRIVSAAQTMSELLDDLLEMSRIGHLVNPQEEVNFNELAQEAVNLLTGLIAKRQVKITIKPDMPLVYADRIRLREVLQNLIENAIKFNGDQTKLSIEIGARGDAALVTFYVRDNGKGIDPDYHEKIFGLFERLDTEVEGTGVGLALAHRIVTLHGGKIWVESADVGNGITFFFTIPRQGNSSELASSDKHALYSG